MAVSEQTPYQEFIANGTTTVFPLNFDAKEQDHLIVLVDDVEPQVGEWSFDFNTDQVTFLKAPKANSVIKIRRDTPLKRDSNYQTYNNSFRPEPVNEDLDSIWYKLQEMGVLNWMVNNDIKDLGAYVDSLNDETKAIFLAEIERQGISLNQLENLTNKIYQNLANIAVTKGWFAEFVATKNGLNQQQVNDDQLKINNNIAEKTVHVKDFGAIGDGLSHPLSEKFSTLEEAQKVYVFAKSLAQEIDQCALQAMCLAYPKNKKLSVDGMILYIGNILEHKSAIQINNPENIEISGNCKIIGINGGNNSVVFGVLNPNKFKSYGIEFFDPTYDRESNIGGVRKGIVGFCFAADSTYNVLKKCGDINLDCKANQCLAAVMFDGTKQSGVVDIPNFYAIHDIRVNAIVRNCYYGISNLYGCTKFNFYVTANDVRRAVINYGPRHGEINVYSENSAGFVGSNAFIEIACEGDFAENNGYTIDIQPTDLKINLSYSGVEAHEGLIHFYHQGSLLTGKITNVTARINLNNLTIDGKNSILNNLNAFVFSHEYVGAIYSSTSRMLDNVDIELNVDGNFSGSPFLLKSIPNNKNGRITLGKNLTTLVPQNKTSIAYFTNFKTTGEITIPQTLSFFGSTARGNMTTAKNFAQLFIKNGRVKYSLSASWTVFDGSGALRVDGLSLAKPNGKESYSVISYDNGFSGQLSASIEGVNRDLIYFYLKSPTTGVNNTAPCNNTGEIRASIEFDLY
ncbi:hypothetical protein [Acinetobacter sp. CFCC 10889]|uniref:hypothetical protein n=1 Tax=Acinetobacter sp. CFCC 10889 TaxID=1775557 RepID=UPI000DD0DEC4|nr:hypothetical protein [Acinetobacter sp. CFCC 10889]